MSKYVINFYGSSGDGMIGYDDSPCISLDMAKVFSSKRLASLHVKKLLRQGYYRFCALRVEKVDFEGVCDE